MIVIIIIIIINLLILFLMGFCYTNSGNRMIFFFCQLKKFREANILVSFCIGAQRLFLYTIYKKRR